MKRQGTYDLSSEVCRPISGRRYRWLFFSDLTHHDIAKQLNQPLGTVKARSAADYLGYGRNATIIMISEEQQDWPLSTFLRSLDTNETAEFEAAMRKGYRAACAGEQFV